MAFSSLVQSQQSKGSVKCSLFGGKINFRPLLCRHQSLHHPYKLSGEILEPSHGPLLSFICWEVVPGFPPLVDQETGAQSCVVAPKVTPLENVLSSPVRQGEKRALGYTAGDAILKACLNWI